MIRIECGMKGDMKSAELLGLLPVHAKKAAQEARKAALKAVRDTAAAEVSGDYWLSPARVRKAVALKSGKSGASVRVTGRRLLLTRYKVTPGRPAAGRGKRLMGAVKRGALKPLGRAFLANVRGEYIPLERQGKARYPVKPLIAPAVPQITEKYAEEMRAEALRTMETVFWEKVRALMK